MIGLDTNVLVRYFAQDDTIQSSAATAIIERFSEHKPGFVSTTALIELAWVLERCYHTPKTELVRILEILLKSREITTENAPLARQALLLFAHGNAGFADCLIERAGVAAGCEYTFTFDRKAVDALPSMKPLTL
ncbi:MAG: type II toxin-antitoxin system VapC family toxin [Azoarcus sp.]|jgi:predicted nucleic-acid-binding protein|nr:type II toxin-antitoxin system VapC family toxin [Azoarcus sp.]